MKEGNIVFLTKRKIKNILDYRGIISYLISLFSNKSFNNLDVIKSHCAIIYSYNDVFMVRDMDMIGTVNYTLEEYLIKYGDRNPVIIINPFCTCNGTKEEFNNSCRELKINYDYNNLLFYQIIKSIFRIFVGKDTITKRICSEDVMRQFNIIQKVFNNPEELNPNELYNKIKIWGEFKWKYTD
jgi:hypothetical protein